MGGRGLKYQTNGGQLTDFFSTNFPMLNQQQSKNNRYDEDDQTIELQGSLLLIYKRNQENKQLIDNLNIVLKGQWKIKGNRQEP